MRLWRCCHLSSPTHRSMCGDPALWSKPFSNSLLLNMCWTWRLASSRQSKAEVNGTLLAYRKTAAFVFGAVACSDMQQLACQEAIPLLCLEADTLWCAKTVRTGLDVNPTRVKSWDYSVPADILIAVSLEAIRQKYETKMLLVTWHTEATR